MGIGEKCRQALRAAKVGPRFDGGYGGIPPNAGMSAYSSGGTGLGPGGW